MGGQSDTQTVTTRYAPYLETEHKDLLQTYRFYREFLTGPIEQPLRPYSNYTDLEIDDAFFGTGYSLTSFPSLYDMYGKFLAGLDVEVLFDEILEETIDGPVVHNLISAEASVLEDDIVENAAPRFETGMRDINSVMSSTFVIGRAMMEVGRTKAISRFSADVRGRLMPVAAERWRYHLEWNKQVVDMYAQILKLYITARMDKDNHNFEIHAKDKLWPFTILHYNVAAIGALSGATTTTQEVAGPSTAQKAIGGALTGAAAGSMINVPFGTIIGALIGLGTGFL